MIKGSKMTIESRKKMSLSKMGIKRPDISFLLKGKSKSESHKNKIKLSKTGKKRPPFSVEWRKNLGEAHKGKKHNERYFELVSGDKNINWKGKNVKYTALHSWVRRWLGKPCKCEFCGLEDKNSLLFEWANKSGNYERDLKDWIRLCVPCHRLMDKQKRNAK